MHVARTAAAVALLTMLVSSPAMGVWTLRVDQKTYNRVDEPKFKGLLYLYAEDIESTSASPGFKPFTVHVIVGRYRAPLLGTKVFFTVEDLERLLTKRPDVWREKFVISRSSGETKTFQAPGVGSFTLKVQKVVPERSGTDHVMIEVL